MDDQNDPVSQKNVVGGSITATNVAIGDQITTNSLVIQGVSKDKITVVVDGKTQEIDKKLDVLIALMQQMAAKSVQSANNIYNINSITNANFGFVVEQTGKQSLPSEKTESLASDQEGWIDCLRQEFVEQGISVSDERFNIFQNYGWLVETFLSKMCTAPGQENLLRRLSFMAEAYQASLRYLCYVQVAQILQMETKPKVPIISDFIQMTGDQYFDFDYTGLLLIATDTLASDGFIKEISAFTDELKDTDGFLFVMALFLNNKRRDLRENKILQNDTLPALLDEYLTALVYWLRKMAFIANYRMVSIKEINLNYGLGTPASYVHQYGELHSTFNSIDPQNDDQQKKDDYSIKQIQGSFTYNRSVLLFNGTDAASAMNNIRNQNSFLSLSPFIIDQSVFLTNTQTPEIYYYSGYDKSKRQYSYSQYKNELPFGGMQNINSNKALAVQEQNNNQPLFNALFKQVDKVLNPFKIKTT